MSQTATFQLLPADISDMLEIARVEFLAFEHLPLLCCAFPDRSSPEALSNRAASLSKQFAMPSSRATKIVDSENKICAAAFWDFYLEPDWTSTKPENELSSREIYGPSANIPLCEDFFGRFHGMFESLMRGKPCATLGILVVLPKFQRKGLGEQLMRDGLEEADKYQLPTWLGATKSGYGLYLKLGFRDVESVAYDLSLYGWKSLVPGEGTVTHVSMVRPSQGKD